MTRWTPEQLRSMGKRYGEEVFCGRDGQLEVPPIRRLLAELCAQAADDAEALATVTVERDALKAEADKMMLAVGDQAGKRMALQDRLGRQSAGLDALKAKVEQLADRWYAEGKLFDAAELKAILKGDQ